MEYEKPEIIDFKWAEAIGQCSNGSGDTSSCSAGDFASLTCLDGNSAGNACSNGAGY